MSAISHAGFTSTLTWDNSVTNNPAKGLMVYNSASGLWEATATFTGLPAVPSNSWGRVPKGLHDLLYGNRTATFTVQNPSGGGALCNSATNYEVYFGDSLVVDGSSLVDIRASSNDVNTLVVGNPLRREIYEKMSCSLQASASEFEFTTLAKASQNFAMRCETVSRMDNISTNADDFSGSYPCARCGDATYNTNSGSWITGTYWHAYDPTDPQEFRFVRNAGASAYDAVTHVTPFRGECMAGVNISIFQAAAATLGKTGFDALHPSDFVGLGYTTGAIDAHYDYAADTNTFVPGDWVYLKNKDDYYSLARSNGVANASWSGENAIYMGLNGSGSALFAGITIPRILESDLREELRINYTNDCRPYIVEDPTVQIRFTVKRRVFVGN